MSRRDGREGYTTGSCAAAAAKAAAHMLLTGERLSIVNITVPRGDVYRTGLYEVMLTKEEASCAVKKDAGDDPDVTDGILVFARARYGRGASDNGASVTIRGGEGIGRVTKPGLDQPVGEAAINSVPRRMITEAVSSVCEKAGYEGAVDITIYAPEGVEIAKHTFNPRLGIEGGISIIGTSGIVEPMSLKAVKDTIYVELKQRRELGYTGVIISPGNYGRQFLLENYRYDIDSAVKCSNFIGETIDMCRKLGFSGVILAGHTGKLVKVASGIMNTHSRESDCRMETIAAAGIRAGLPRGVLIRILDSVSTAEAFGIIKEYDEEHPGAKTANDIMSTLASRIKYYLELRSEGLMEIETTIYCGENALSGETPHMRDLLERIMKE